MGMIRRAGLAAAAAAAPLGLAYRFALAYRVRAGYPRQNPPLVTPADLGLPFETTVVESDGLELPAWFIPARFGQPGPGVVLVHGWESARDRTLPMAIFLHAAGFHCLAFDVRGHGANPAELLPLTGGEFGRDAAAAFRTLIARPEVTVGAVSGHSMGAVGAILAAAADRRVAALVASSTPAEPYRLTRQTFRLAHLPIPDPIAYPLAWLTTRVYLQPRGHRVAEISASAAIARYAGPILLAHGDQDSVVPVAHLARLAEAARRARRWSRAQATIETLIVAGGQHSWLYEDPGYRRAVARMLSMACGGPLDPDAAGEIAAATHAERLPDAETRFAAMEETHGGLRTLAQVALPGATRPPTVEARGPGGPGGQVEARGPGGPVARAGAASDLLAVPDAAES
jgi:pimeloyl-ACP methyl ester carboxylesterase